MGLAGGGSGRSWGKVLKEMLGGARVKEGLGEELDRAEGKLRESRVEPGERGGGGAERGWCHRRSKTELAGM